MLETEVKEIRLLLGIKIKRIQSEDLSRFGITGRKISFCRT